MNKFEPPIHTFHVFCTTVKNVGYNSIAW